MNLLELLSGRNKASKVVNQRTEDRQSGISDPGMILGVDKYNAWKVVSKLRDLNDIYKYRYLEYDNMEQDVIIQSALELYSDDSTQLDANLSKIVIVDSKDADLAGDLNTFLHSHIRVDSRIWQWAYDISKYGDFYLKLYRSKAEDRDDDIDNYGNENLREVTSQVDGLEESDNYFRVEEVEDPSEVMDLWYKGQRVAYAEEVKTRVDDYTTTQVDGNTTVALELKDKNSYVHFMIRRGNKSDKVDIPLHKYESTQFGNDVKQKFKTFSVVRGSSMIEGVRSIYRILQLLEDSLLAAKIAKAEFVRVYNIEVGDDTPGKTTETINRVKNLFDAKASYDVVSGRYRANKEYRPIGDPIFNPVRNGKGSVSHEDIGGEFEVKNLVDVDYFNNKLFAGLKIPKAYLGYEESLPGGLGDNTLVRMDIRYSRSVRRVQNALINGIKDLCIIWCESNGRVVNADDFEIKLLSPSSSEELSRLSELDLRINTIDKIASSIQGTVGDYVNMPKIVSLLYKNYLDYPELKSDLLKEIEAGINNYKSKIEAEKKANEDIINGDDGYNEQDFDVE